MLSISKKVRPPLREILFDNYYYDVTNWVKIHPGGGVINFYTQHGEDASLAIRQFHQRSEKKVTKIMNCLNRRPTNVVEKIETFENGKSNPRNHENLESIVSSTIESKKHRKLTADFIHLYNELIEEGIFAPSILNTVLRLSEVIILLAVGLYLIPSQNILLKTFAIICLSLYSSRGSFVVHEAGHRSLTGNPTIDQLIENITFGLCAGLSGSFWSSQHNRHHAMPQRLNHDVDLETMPLMAFNKKVVKNSASGKSFFVQYQAFLFILIDTYLVALIWKFYAHPKYVLHKKRYLELLFMFAHYLLVYFTGVWFYLMVTWLASLHLFGTFTLNHSHLPVTLKSKHWVEYAFEHTMNTHSNLFGDWWTGYLNHQIEHHLFPTIPNFRLKKISGRVKILAAKHSLPYQCVSYSDAVILSLKNLHKVSQELDH